MKLVLLPAFALLAMIVPAMADTSNDPLLDAKIEVAALQANYGAEHPQSIDAKARVEAVAETIPPVPRAEYVVHLRERLHALQQESTVLSQDFADKHPKRLAVAAKLAFVVQELHRLGH